MTTKHVLIIQHLRPYREGEQPHKVADWYDFMEMDASNAPRAELIAARERHLTKEFRIVERVICESIVWPSESADMKSRLESSESALTQAVQNHAAACEVINAVHSALNMTQNQYRPDDYRRAIYDLRDRPNPTC